MTIIPCSKNDDLQKKIEEFSEELRTQAHLALERASRYRMSRS